MSLTFTGSKAGTTTFDFNCDTKHALENSAEPPVDLSTGWFAGTVEVI
jgi:hypothetical protein